MKLQYVGPHVDGVVVPLPGGTEIFVEHKGVGDFPKELAERLLRQGSNWRPAPRSERSPSAATAKKKEE